jgi:hypothetical protein
MQKTLKHKKIAMCVLYKRARERTRNTCTVDHIFELEICVCGKATIKENLFNDFRNR